MPVCSEPALATPRHRLSIAAAAMAKPCCFMVRLLGEGYRNFNLNTATKGRQATNATLGLQICPVKLIVRFLLPYRRRFLMTEKISRVDPRQPWRYPSSFGARVLCNLIPPSPLRSHSHALRHRGSLGWIWRRQSRRKRSFRQAPAMKPQPPLLPFRKSGSGTPTPRRYRSFLSTSHGSRLPKTPLPLTSNGERSCATGT